MKNKLNGLIVILSIIAITYNIILFIFTGFVDHTSSFWVSWSFMTIAFLSIIGITLVFGKKIFSLKDWLFAYPFVRYSAIYITCEFIVSTCFIVAEKKISWQWPTATQLIVLIVYAIVFISCLVSKETIQKVDAKVNEKTRFVRLLKIDADMLVEKCNDPALNKKCLDFAEAVRYSDPMSSDALFELEKDIALTVSECDRAITQNEYDLASELCDKAMLLLSERNKKTKALK